jgi:hypothetical protein
MNALNLKNQKTILILLVLFFFMWTQRIHVRDFFEGILQGYSTNNASHAITK